MAEIDPHLLGNRAAGDGGHDRGGGVVVVTRFDCPGLWSLLVILVMHWRLKRAVRQQATGYLGVARIVRLRERTLLNISLWEDLESLRSMGRVPRHVDATRVPRRLGVSTSGGVYPFAGDWRQVLFAIPGQSRPPLRQSARRN